MIALLLAGSIGAAPVEVGPKPTDARFYELVEEKITSRLADPEAARIKWDRQVAPQSFKPVIGAKVVGWWTCGLMNAKNHMGGYVGYRRFIAFVRDDKVIYTNTSESPDDFADRACSAAIQSGELPPLEAPMRTGAAPPDIANGE